MYLNELPDSILLKVFNYLPIRKRFQLRRVCSKWSVLLCDFSIWSTICVGDRTLMPSHINEDILVGWIQTWGNTIKVLNFKEIRWISEKTITAIVKNCPDLQGFYIEGCFQISDPALVQIAFHCRHLVSVNLFLTGVTDVGFEYLVMNCPELKRIKLGSRGSCYKMLQSLYKHSSKLKHISIHDVIPFDEVEQAVDDLIINELTKCFSGLKTIDFTWCCFISDDALVTISHCCPQLSKLTVRECHKISDRGVASVLRDCPALSHLQLERLYNVTDCSFTEGLKGKSQLTKLLFLKLADTAVTDKGIALLAEKSPNLDSFQALQTLPNNIIGHCILVISRSCKKLKRFKVLSIKMTDNFLGEIGENLHELRHLYLGDCGSVTRAGLLKVINNCPMLVKLNVRECPHLDDAILGIMAKHLKHLKELEIYGCQNVTAAGITEVVTRGSDCVVSI